MYSYARANVHINNEKTRKIPMRTSCGPTQENKTNKLKRSIGAFIIIYYYYYYGFFFLQIV